MRTYHAWLLSCLLSLIPINSSAQQLTDTYNRQRPVIIACDWNKAPYEFLNDQGEPTGSNIDVLKAIFQELDIPCRFVMKEWGNAIKTFERGEADLILANTRRYINNSDYCWTDNIINYNRIVAATIQEKQGVLSLKRLVEEGVVLKPEDYTKYYFLQEDSTYLEKIDFQAPKTAIIGLEEGDYGYFLWGEEPIKWKLKELNIENVRLINVNIPISEIHVVGRDKTLIDAIDDHYSRMKQRGELEQINNRWFHPERVTSETPSVALYILIGVVVLALLLWLANRLSKAHVRSVTRESTDLNNMMLKALHMGSYHIMEYDIAGDRFTNHYGHILPQESMTLEEFTSHIHPDEQQEFSHKMKRLISGREMKFDLEKRWNAGTADNPQWLILEGHAMVELDEHGHPAYVVNAVHNITHDIEVERDTYEKKKKYEVLSNMPLLATSFYDKDGYLMELNDAMKEICGFKDKDVNIERFWRKVCMFDVPLFRNAYSPEDRHDLYVCQHMEYPNMDVNRYIEFYVHPLFNKQGELINYLVSVFDISDEHNSCQQINNTQKKLKQTDKEIQFYDWQLTKLIDCSNLYLWHSDIPKQTINFYKSLRNRRLIEENMNDFLSHIVVGEQDVASYIFNNTDPQQADLNMVLHFDNSIIAEGDNWFNMKATPVRNTQGAVTGHRGISYKLTKTIKLQQELHEVTRRAEKRNQLKNGFMASMTHELRTPLNAIVGFTDVLRVTENPKEREEFIRIVRNSCDMLVRLINDIFEASNITEGPDSIEPAKVDFAKAFDDICLMLSQRVTEPGISFEKDNPYDTFTTTLDIGRLQQIITNFVTNAVKFTKQGHIRLGYRYERYGLYIYCEDTGMGIPKEKQSLIFERFVKLDEYSQGTGLGLNICKSIAERCGGRIGVNSEGLGHGSTFWVWIPCDIREVKP